MNNKTDETHGSYELFMLVLCVFALASMAIVMSGRLDAGTLQILSSMDWGVCVIFMIDFLINLWRAPKRWRYMITWGWLDLLSSIPIINVFRIGRLARVFRIFRRFRGIKVARLVAGLTRGRRAQSAFLAAVLITLITVTFGGIAVLQFETDPNSNIKNASDAIWWAITTLTTVGYGDRYPVTNPGRFVGAALMVTGIGLFGTLSGFVVSWLVATNKPQQDEIEKLRTELAELKASMSSQGPDGKVGESSPDIKP